MELYLGKWTVLVDDDIVMDLLAMGRWKVINNYKRHPYAVLQRGDSFLTMHRHIMGVTDPNDIVDHINQNPMDNRRENLRVVTKLQNTWNRKIQGGKFPNTTGLRGVRKFITPHGKTVWKATFLHKGTKVSVGTWKTPEEAARAYDRGIKHYRGEFGVLNFPGEDPGPLEAKYSKRCQI